MVGVNAVISGVIALIENITKLTIDQEVRINGGANWVNLLRYTLFFHPPIRTWLWQFNFLWLSLDEVFIIRVVEKSLLHVPFDLFAGSQSSILVLIVFRSH